MSDNEFDLLDELYFVTPFHELQDKLDFDEDTLKQTLLACYEKGWIKVLTDQDTEIKVDKDKILQQGSQYMYLATKKGLMTHNGR